MSIKDKAKCEGTNALALGLPFIIMTFGAFGMRVKG